MSSSTQTLLFNASPRDWNRPRRQTDADLLFRRPSDLIRQAARRSVDYSAPADTRPRTSASNTTTTTNTTITPPRPSATISANALSNPALAEIPSRKYNALRLSPSSGGNHSAPSSPNHVVQCAPGSRDAPSSPLQVQTPKRRSLQSFSRRQSILEPRSPSLRRSPASRSSIAVDLVNHSAPPAVASAQHGSPGRERLLRRSSTSDKTERGSIPNMEPERRRETRSPTASAANTGNDTRTESSDALAGTEDNRGSSTDDSRSRSDDVFLNIAKSSARRNSLSRLERRRRLLGVSGLSTRNSFTDESSLLEPVIPHGGSSPIYPSSASAHPLDDLGRSRKSVVGSSARSTIGIPPSRFRRSPSPDLARTYEALRSSIADARYRHSNLSSLSGARTVRQGPSPDPLDRSRADDKSSRLDGTESTLSTTAPSTVWDELDDLKSRIRKLELTGKFPPSNASGISSTSAERPRTATTTVTTISSSPKVARKTGSTSDADEGGSTNANQIQTLLHSALAKAKSAVSTEVFQALEATVTDALTLNNMLGTNSPGVGMSERQLKRKADSLCRSLTELCLALSEGQAKTSSKTQSTVTGTQETQRTNNGDEAPSKTSGLTTPVTTASRFRRSMSHEPEETQDSASRVSSRLETRRATTIHLGAVRNRYGQDDSSTSPKTPSLAASTSRLSRLASARAKREEDADDKASVLSRFGAPSRAATEVDFSTGRRSTVRDRLVREYANANANDASSSTTRLAQPAGTVTANRNGSTMQSSSIPLRRSYTAFNGVPATSGMNNIQPGFRRYAVNNSPNHSPSSAEPMTSTTAASSGKPSTQSIPQPRLASRRLGLRLRYSSTSPVEPGEP